MTTLENTPRSNDEIPVDNVKEMTSELLQSNVEPTKTKFVEPPMNLMPTLPENFKSLIGASISIKNEKENVQDLIRFLGSILGVDDYEKNMASFWFLDFIGFQLLRFENSIDDNEKAILASWLVGEMKLIRDTRLSHEHFLRHVRKIFDKTSEEIARGKPVLNWNLSTKESNLQDSIIEEDSKNMEKESGTSSPRIMKRSSSLKSRHRRISSKETSRHSVRSERSKAYRSESFNKGETKLDARNAGSKLLDAIIEATYDMYGDNFHYTLIRKAFVEPIQLHDVKLPSVLRVPRPVKVFGEEKKGLDRPAAQKSKELHSQATKLFSDNKKTRKERDSKSLDAVKKATIPMHIAEEEITQRTREFILPLMEANEAASVLENYKRMQLD